MSCPALLTTKSQSWTNCCRGITFPNSEQDAYVKRVELAVPSGTTSAQWKIINDKITSAANQGVQLNVTVVQ